MSITQADLFAPVCSLIQVDDMQEAIRAYQDCPYRLGVSIFGPRNFAEHWAKQIDAGCIVINDVIVPTADPRVGFGGRGKSGWGTTRGAEGLLEMTRPKTICVRREVGSHTWTKRVRKMQNCLAAFCSCFTASHYAKSSRRCGQLFAKDAKRNSREAVA